MGDWNMGLGTLNERTVSRLADLLDNSSCGWRQLASMVTEQPRYRWSEKELTSCSLQVLSPTGSPGRCLLAKLIEHSCTLGFLLHCLNKMDHKDAVQYLTATVMEQIRITVQPQAQLASEGAKVVLTCRASGPVGLAYQWFRGKDEICGGCDPELVLNHLSPFHQGYYICRVNYGDSCVFSQWAQLRLVRSTGTSSGGSGSYFPSAVSGLCIMQQPRAQVLSEGEHLVLECLAEANPPAQYQWYHDQKPVPQAQTCSLRIPYVTTVDRGQYSCKVFNLYHEAWSDRAHVNIGPSSVLDASCTEVDHGSGVTPSPDRPRSSFHATDKVALLMGNMNYQCHRQLRAPMADVHELTNQLRQLDFKVVSLLDLSWQEMHSAVMEFLLLLDKGVYGLLYFAGHGYENYGNSFMVPIDAPASYTSEHCLWVQDILQKMQEKETGLNVFLLDMCRKRNLNDDIIQQPGPLKVTANIVFGYATCVDAEAFEVNKDDLSNGIFISYLKQRLCEDEKVTVMLDRVAEDMGRCAITRGRQALELRSNLSERRALTDRIQCSDCPAATSARNLQWAIAHVLPESRNLQFDCGVKVQLGFAAEFSNIMIIYTRILEKPKDISYCSAHITDLPEVLDIDVKRSNQASLVEAGSLLLSMACMPAPELPSLYTRIRDLQRLKTDLAFTVCLQYQYSNLDEEVQEQQEISVGKPLVSKLNLYEPRLQRLYSTSSDLPSYSLPESSSFSEGFGPSCAGSETSSIGSASTSWSYYPQSGAPFSPSHGVNQPEETDSLDMLDCDAPHSLTTSKSLPYGHGDDSYQFSDLRNFHSC